MQVSLCSIVKDCIVQRVNNLGVFSIKSFTTMVCAKQTMVVENHLTKGGNDGLVSSPGQVINNGSVEEFWHTIESLIQVCLLQLGRRINLSFVPSMQPNLESLS